MNKNNIVITTESKDSVVDNCFMVQESKKNIFEASTPYIFSRNPDMPMPTITSVANAIKNMHQHKLTCDKKRKNRKKKRK